MITAEFSQLFPFSNNLFNNKGEVIGMQIAQRIAEDPTIKRVFLFGEPGVGKTVVKTQLALVVASLAPDNMEHLFVAMEDAMNETEEILRTARSDWVNVEYDFMADRLYRRVREHDPVINHDGEQRVILYTESLSMVGSDDLNRAVTPLKKLAREQKTDPNSPKNIFLGFPADPAAQMRTGLIRAEVTLAPDAGVIGLLKDKYHVLIVGVSDTPENGRRVKAIYKKQASKDRMMEVSVKIREAASAWGISARNQKQVHKTWIPENILTREVPEEFTNRALGMEAESLVDIYRHKTAYLERYMLREKMRLSAENGILLHNPLDIDQTIILDLSSFLSR